MRGFLFRLTNDHALAQDLAQDTFLRAWAKLHTLREAASFSTWLMRMAYNLFLTNARSRSRYRELLTRAHAQPESRQLLGSDVSTTGDSDLDSGWTDLPKLMSVLNEEQRAIFVLSYAHEYSHAQISDILSLPVGTVKSHLLRGKQAIQRRFGLGSGGRS